MDEARRFAVSAVLSVALHAGALGLAHAHGLLVSETPLTPFLTVRIAMQNAGPGAGAPAALADAPSSSEPPGSATAGRSGVGASTPGGGDGGDWIPGRPLGGYQVSPRYPESLRQRRVEGNTELRVRVLADGRVGEVRVERSSGHGELDSAAEEAVRQWRFEPARRHGSPVEVWVVIPFRFQLR